eukprot:COSAG01_NODE_1770_length_9272_cov_5.371198_2_plen_412_part_00
MISCDDAYCQGLLANLKEHLKQPLLFETTLDKGATTDTVKAIMAAAQKEFGQRGQSCTTAADESQLTEAPVTPQVLVLLAHAQDTERMLAAAARMERPLAADFVASESYGSSVPSLDIQNVGVISLRFASPRDNYGLGVAAALGVYIGAGKSPGFALMAYDATWALAHAMHAVRLSGPDLRDRTTGAAVLAALRNVSFSGASGPVAFDANLDRVGAGYDVVQDGAGGRRIKIASWSPPGTLALDMSADSIRRTRLSACELGEEPGSTSWVTVAIVAIPVGVAVTCLAIALYKLWQRILKRTMGRELYKLWQRKVGRHLDLEEVVATVGVPEKGDAEEVGMHPLRRTTSLPTVSQRGDSDGVWTSIKTEEFVLALRQVTRHMAGESKFLASFSVQKVLRAYTQHPGRFVVRL